MSHVHACPECYVHEPCWLDCDCNLGMFLNDGTPCGNHALCSACEAAAPKPWTPERREKAGRAAWAADRDLAGMRPAWFSWDHESVSLKKKYCDLGEAAVRADEGGEG